MLADEHVRVQRPLRICLGCRSKSKNRDKQLTHSIVRVSTSILLMATIIYLHIDFLILNHFAQLSHNSPQSSDLFSEKLMIVL